MCCKQISERYNALKKKEQEAYTSQQQTEKEIYMFCQEQLLGKVFKSGSSYYYITDITCEEETEEMLYINYLYLSLHMLPVTTEEVEEEMDDMLETGLMGYAIEERGEHFNELPFLHANIELIAAEDFVKEMDFIFHTLKKDITRVQQHLSTGDDNK